MTQLQALAASVLIEALVVSALLAATAPTETPRAKMLVRWLAIGCCLTLVTHPLAWRANTEWLAHMEFWARAGIIEVAVTIIEGGLLWLLCSRRVSTCMLISAAANGASFGLGLLWFYGTR